MQIAVLGIDLGKNSCSVVGLDQAGAVVKRHRMRPESIPALTKTTSATPLGGRLRALMQRVHKNAAVVALANKLARIVWVVLRRGEAFDAAAVRAAP